MAINTAALIHDAASVYRFVHSVSTVAEESSTSVYVPASDKFFAYVRQLADRTKAYLADFPKYSPADDFLALIYRQKLTILLEAWSELHRYIKPASDADTLNTPFSLLSALYRKFHELNGFEHVEFTVFHLNDVNYHQVRASWFRQLATKVASQIPGAPPFPADLGLIGIPYSQSSAIFLNALIPHEMGHFVYQQLDKSTELLPFINTSLGVRGNSCENM